MMWNYRVVRKEYESANEIEVLFGIHEVYYDDDGKPTMCTQNPVDVIGDNVAEVKDTLAHMLVALEKPVLEYSDF